MVIACTGFRIKHSFFDKDFINYEEGMVPLLHRMIPADINNIYFIGLFQPLGVYGLCRASIKTCCKTFIRTMEAKKSIRDLLDKEMANPDVPQLETPRPP